MKANNRITASMIAYLVLAVIAGCGMAKRAPPTSVPVNVFQHYDDLLGCHEVGLVAKTDGCLRLSTACCAAVEHSPPTRDRAIALVAKAARRLGANAVLILHVAQQDNYITDCEGCCSVTAYRAYGIAFRCGDDMLEWHLSHEKQPNH